MITVEDISGKTFNYLTAIDYAGKYKWNCVCVCGKKKIAYTSHLKSGDVRSCGCKKVKTTTHGKRNSSEYITWAGIKARCYNPKEPAYSDYGGRGITVCDRWRNSFEAFYEDMGDKPSIWHSLDRIENSKGYYKENCRWATMEEQANNKRNNIVLTYKGKTQTLAQWCRELNLSYRAIHKRILYKKWSPEKSFETPVRIVNI